jgi:tetraacyldisaccharide 4'-kinase
MFFALAAQLYGYAIARRNAAFDAGLRPIVRCTVPVVSVGNVLAGGTGKTPVTAMLVGLLQELGHSPAIVARGYRRSGSGLVVVHDGHHLRATASQAGDEPLDLARQCNVAVVVDRVKTEAAVYAAGHLPCSVVVVDDGFQHRTLGREVDVVIVDRATLDGALLPAGRLREPLTELRRATCVLRTADVTDGDLANRVHQDAVVATVEFSCRIPEAIAQAPLLALSSIARPERFATTLQQQGLNVVHHMALPDHARYRRRRVKAIVRLALTLGVQHVVTTSKDFVKIEPFLDAFHAGNLNVHVAQYTAQLTHNAAGVVDLLRNRCPLHNLDRTHHE